MEAMVNLATVGVGKDQIARWLSETAGPHEAAVRAATAHLEAARTVPKFALCLLVLSAGGDEKGQRVAAATYLKNYLRNHWSEDSAMPAVERLEFRNQLVEILLRVDGIVLKLLAEAFRLVAVNDFARKTSWPELVPALRTAIQNSDLVNGAGEASEFKTFNVLIGVQTIIKPFQYFMDPTVAREPVPEQLELIGKELLVPLHSIFHHLVQQVAASKDEGAAAHDNILLVLCKSFHLAIKSHMPVSLALYLGQWFQDIMVLLQMVVLDKTLDAPHQYHRLKTWKRALQICCNLITRHRKYVDKYLPSMSHMALKLLSQNRSKGLHPMQERIISLAFDVVSNILETGPGWRLMAPHFSNLLESAIFPTLRLSEEDMAEWEEDEDEYLRKNLPSDMDEASGWKEDLLIPRQSAINLLGLIATSKGPPTTVAAKKVAAMKRKKAGKGKGKDGQGTAGELLVLPFLSQFPLPPPEAASASDLVKNYYGALMAYGGLTQFLKTQSPDKVSFLLQTRVFPLYTMGTPSPYVLANANWLLGELAACLPEELNEDIYNALLKALLAPNVGDVSWRPVRASAAGALSTLLQEEYKPVQWLPLLQAAVAGARMVEEGEATIALQLLANVAEAGEDHVAPHVPAITAAVQGEICRHIPPHPEPWPQMVELGFSAVASLAQTWDSAEPEEDEDGGKALENWKMGCITVANTFSELLQRAWLPTSPDGSSVVAAPPPSCLNDASTLLAAVLRYTNDSTIAATLKVEPLLQVWANLISEWSAWEEEEDESVFEAIEEAILLHGRSPLRHFTVADVLPALSGTSAPTRSILEGLVTFVTSAIEGAYPAAAWRACRCTHAILHASSLAFEGEEISKVLVNRFVQATFRRLKALSRFTVPLAKPLVLVIATCYVCLPKETEQVLNLEDDKKVDEGHGENLLLWGEALAILSETEADPGLSLECEIKLCVLALLKLLERLMSKEMAEGSKGFLVAQHCFKSLLESTVDLKEVQESSSIDDSDDDDSDDSDGSEDSDEDDDDDDDSNSNSDDDDSSDEEHEETEDEFLARYARTARELDLQAIEEAEGGQDEDGQDIELGVLGLVNPECQVMTFIKDHGKTLLTKLSLSKDLVSRFIDKFPGSKQLLSQ
ncbi:hypothetical protein MPTK1_1g26560 [Marchantia polymorpha subsp. ruderalis]|uniref:Importin N-terminal domain-containing protein n=2 Tax=Marchantia polymorpha TaxID=3197 RepID=A0A176WN06_MARPO|nr:hypothetical protein AXG93_4689s1120 [Marchantia polymorpha subsp. ruderalis]PTQ49763.1 hypothetical protein MARPO_0002s0222 [Marchantia polymorpha]BBN00117.1 hypothetical protein Mp_1g26560 [Marchantia polymorpha subsp. ruderalis]|eukprot:PTQ49763.1 hypothetical protein MARPO_0002s0222 [Marchantia polymorpha]